MTKRQCSRWAACVAVVSLLLAFGFVFPPRLTATFTAADGKRTIDLHGSPGYGAPEGHFPTSRLS